MATNTGQANAPSIVRRVRTPRLHAMAPACVLLYCLICFDDDDDDDDDPAIGVGVCFDDDDDDDDPAIGVGVCDDDDPAIGVEDGVALYLRAMKVDPQVAEPPAVSHLAMTCSSDPSIPQFDFRRNLDSALVVAAAKNLVLLYAGSYSPCRHGLGCYLLYDAAAAAGSSSSSYLSTIPGVPYDYDAFCCGVQRPVLMAPAADGEAFVLAELLIRNYSPEPPCPDDGVLCLWLPSLGKWIRKVGRLPAEVCPPFCAFSPNVAFAVDGSLCCWADLLWGLLLCDSAAGDDNLEFRYVPLPDGHAIPVTNAECQLRPSEFRTMGYVAGAVKFVTVDGYMHRRPPSGEGVTVTTWTLDMQEGRWSKDTELRVGDLWADEAFVSGGVPRLVPSYPVLSMQQRDVVYLLLARYELIDDREYSVQYLVSVDTRRHTVLSFNDCGGDDLYLGDCLIHSEFSAYL
ncbi:hypothetical protein ACP4OV_001633 [Aristida adscensionis]